MSERRQFIAGATCPQCGQLDKIQRVQADERLWMECIACGMVRDLDQAPATGTSDGTAPVTILPAPGQDKNQK